MTESTSALSRPRASPDVDLPGEQARPVLDGAVLGAGRLQVLDAGEQLVGVALRTGLGFQARCHQALVAAARQRR